MKSTLACQLWAGAKKMKTFQNLGDGARLAPARPTENLPGALRERSGPALATVVTSIGS
jgi:hypothetical protein